MNSKQKSTILEEREALLADAMSPLLPKLKSVSPVYYCEFLEQGLHPEIDSFVNLVLASYYTPSAFMFACTGKAKRQLENVNGIKLDFELVANGIFAFFRVNIFSSFPTVEIHHISFETGAVDPHINTLLLQKTLKIVRS